MTRTSHLSGKLKVAFLAFLILGILGLSLYLKNRSEIFFNRASWRKFGHVASHGKLESLVACPLDGVWTTPEKAFRHPLAISIENHPQSRPQSGLVKASLIFETPTEGGITRFLAIYVENDGEKIGPVRSARTYFLDWLSEFDGIFAHCGGNADALALIRPYNIKDLDEFHYPRLYWRSADRSAPHNLYTKTSNLWDKAKVLGWDKRVNYAPWLYKEDLEKGKRPAAQEIYIAYANPSFRVRYVYNPENNNYQRFIGTLPHLDKETGIQLAPKNVAVMWIAAWPLYDPEGGWHLETIASGPAKVFLDGRVISGTWKKESRFARTKFYAENGQEIVFNRGQTWIQVVPEGTEVRY